MAGFETSCCTMDSATKLPVLVIGQALIAPLVGEPHDAMDRIEVTESNMPVTIA
jgi:hypothetical protein